MSSKINYCISVLFIVLILNAISDLTMHFFGSGLHLGHLRALTFIIIILSCYLINVKHIDKLSVIILLLTIYLFILVLFADNFSKSFDTFLKFTISLNMFFVGFSFLRKEKYIEIFFRGVIISLSIILIYIGAAQIIPGLGVADYSSVKLPSMGDQGGTGVYVLNLVSYLSLIFPLYYFNKNSNKFYKFLFILMLFSSALLLVLVFRRGALAVFFLGFAIIFLLNFKSRKQLKLLLFIIPIFALLSPYLIDQFQIRLEERGGLERMTSENYSRGYDIYLASEMLLEGNVKKIIIGESSKIFNHTRVGWVIPDRKVHNDYAAIFLGSGFIGLFLFLAIHLKIFTFNRNQYKRKESKYGKILLATVYAVLFATILQSMANQYWNLSSLSTSFFILGVLSRYNKLLNN